MNGITKFYVVKCPFCGKSVRIIDGNYGYQCAACKKLFSVKISNTPPVVEEAPAPAVEEAPAPVVEEAPAPAVEEAPAPAVEEAPAPAVEETPAPVVEEVAVTEEPVQE